MEESLFAGREGQNAEAEQGKYVIVELVLK